MNVISLKLCTILVGIRWKYDDKDYLSLTAVESLIFFRNVKYELNFPLFQQKKNLNKLGNFTAYKQMLVY